jgi:hypothetical protein
MPSAPWLAESTSVARELRRGERRRSERQPHVVQAHICCSADAALGSPRREVTSVNVSRHGIAFDFDQPLPRETRYTIEIDLYGQQRLVASIRIVSCLPIEDGMYQIGAEFC